MTDKLQLWEVSITFSMDVQANSQDSAEDTMIGLIEEYLNATVGIDLDDKDHGMAVTYSSEPIA